ncbi:MAG: hypothetical protein HN392_04260 [Anaerolineae bacterium]|nr:hypothetical protein [Anaerolineae bacterium]MBT7073282.1 hypothetical protein [Anaerolineae bacterium]MBT7781918.1 hypothetical protein [Anaerolineae bacterium]
MKSRDALDLNLRAVGQHLLGVIVTPLTPRICLGAAPKLKPVLSRVEVSRACRPALYPEYY